MPKRPFTNPFRITKDDDLQRHAPIGSEKRKRLDKFMKDLESSDEDLNISQLEEVFRISNCKYTIYETSKKSRTENSNVSAEVPDSFGDAVDKVDRPPPPSSFIFTAEQERRRNKEIKKFEKIVEEEQKKAEERRQEEERK